MYKARFGFNRIMLDYISYPTASIETVATEKEGIAINDITRAMRVAHSTTLVRLVIRMFVNILVVTYSYQVHTESFAFLASREVRPTHFLPSPLICKSRISNTGSIFDHRTNIIDKVE